MHVAWVKIIRGATPLILLRHRVRASFRKRRLPSGSSSREDRNVPSMNDTGRLLLIPMLITQRETRREGKFY